MIRLLLVDSQTLIRQGLKAILSLEPDLQVVGCADNGQTAIEQVVALQPDVVLMDMQMPVIDGREATRMITQQFPDIKVLVLSSFNDAQDIAQLMRAGAKGYLLKDMPSQELAQAIRLVHRGHSQLAPGLMEKLLTSIPDSDTVTSKPIPQGLTQRSTGGAELAQLSPRKQDVLRLLGRGSPNREIAQQLFISEGTVKTHVTHLMNHLNLRNRAQLAIYANSVFLGSQELVP